MFVGPNMVSELNCVKQWLMLGTTLSEKSGSCNADLPNRPLWLLVTLHFVAVLVFLLLLMLALLALHLVAGHFVASHLVVLHLIVLLLASLRLLLRKGRDDCRTCYERGG